MSESQQPVATRFFKTRVAQELIGRLPNGERIPGGPYTIPQVLAGFVAGFIALKTKPLWETGSWIIDMAIIACAVIGLVILLKHTVSSEPELLTTRAQGWLSLAQHRSSRPGTYRGRAYPVRPAGHRARGIVLIDRRLVPSASLPVQDPAPPHVQNHAPAPAPVAPEPEPVASVPARTSLSGLEHLLASTSHSHN